PGEIQLWFRIVEPPLFDPVLGCATLFLSYTMTVYAVRSTPVSLLPLHSYAMVINPSFWNSGGCSKGGSGKWMRTESFLNLSPAFRLAGEPNDVHLEDDVRVSHGS